MQLSNRVNRNGDEPIARISRRAAIKRLGAATGCAALAAARAWAEPAEATARRDSSRPEMTVLLSEPIGTIQPALYGQFLEHLGGVIHDGVWVGPDSKIPHTAGIRQAVVDHLLRLGPTVVRWPGGCFADRYHWRDGLGEPSKRPKRFGRWREDTESNQFGTHEFMRFCRLCKVQPYIAANVGTGTPEEFQQWIEYCNAPAGKTTLADERAQNGDSEGFGVRFWGVGNESWGCGGKFTPEDYCTEYRRFTDWLPSYGTPLFLIAAGPGRNDLDWTRRFFKKWSDYARAPLDGWAAHYYCGTTGHALSFSRDQWYQMLHAADGIGKLIADQWQAMAEFDPEHKVKLVVDEWGTWHPPGTEVNRAHLFEQMGCLRDALVAALTLDTFNRHADKLAMANIAQMINCLQSLFLADGDKFVATPNFYVFEMYRPHQQAESLRVEVAAPDVSFQTAEGTRSLWQVAGSASRRDKDVTVTLVHAEAEQPLEFAIRLRDARADRVRQTVLTHGQLHAHNTFENPNEVVPRETATSLEGSTLVVSLPPASVVRLDIHLA
jgi:alpha-N-arabinofuranosidase